MDAWRLDQWRQDVRYAVRGLVRAPAFAATVAIVLGVGIGTTAAVFALLNAMFLVPPPVRAPDRVLHVLASSPGNSGALTAEEAHRIEVESRGLDAVGAWTSTTATIGGGADAGGVDEPRDEDGGGAHGRTGAGGEARVEPMSVSAAVVSPGAFHLFDVAPVAGRLFDADDFVGDGRAAVLIGERVWRRALNADARAIGRALRVNGEPRTIVGILPAGFAPFGYELWLPAAGGGAAASQAPVPARGASPDANLGAVARAGAGTGIGIGVGATRTAGIPAARLDRITRSVVLLVRMRPGVSVAQVQEELRGVARRLARDAPETPRGWTLRAQPVRALFGSYPPQTVAWLFAAVVMLWAIACVNVANLLLSRGLDRGREASIRAALGATRGRLVRQFVTEGAVLGLLGALCGLLCAAWSLRLVRAVLPENLAQFGLPRGLDSVRLDPLVLLFLIGCTCATVILFALLPAVRVARAASGRASAATLAGALTQRGAVAGLGHAWRWTLRDALVVAEIALSVVLLIGAALMVASFQRMVTTDRGMTLDRVITLDLQLAAPRDRASDDRRQALRDVLREVAGVSGVEAAALSSFRLRVPVGLGSESPSPSAPNDRRVDLWTVSPEYATVLGIPLLRGEGLGAGATGATDAVHSVLINRTMAQRFWPDRDPIGQSFTIARTAASAPASASPSASASASASPSTSPPSDRLIVAGVVGDVRWMRIPVRPFDLDPHPTVYRLRDAEEAGAYARLSVRTSGPPAPMADAVRRAIWRVDRDLPLQVRIADDLLARELARPRFNATLAGLFAALALALAVLGVYSVVAFAVTRARREFAVRLALGARRADIFRFVLAWASRLAIAGLAVGVAAALSLARAARSQLFEVSATDPGVTAGVACVVMLVMTLAVCIPARRASRVEPARALGAGVDA